MRMSVSTKTFIADPDEKGDEVVGNRLPCGNHIYLMNQLFMKSGGKYLFHGIDPQSTMLTQE